MKTPERNTVSTDPDASEQPWEHKKIEHECCIHCSDVHGHAPHTMDGCPRREAPRAEVENAPRPTASETLYAATKMLEQAGFTVDYGDGEVSIVKALTQHNLEMDPDPTLVIECVMCYTQNKSGDAQFIVGGHSVCASHVDEVIEQA